MYRQRRVQDFFHRGQIIFLGREGQKYFNKHFTFTYNGLKPEECSTVGQKGQMPLMKQIREGGIFSQLNMPRMKKTCVSFLIFCPLPSLVLYATRADFFGGGAILLLMNISASLINGICS